MIEHPLIDTFDLVDLWEEVEGRMSGHENDTWHPPSGMLVSKWSALNRVIEARYAVEPGPWNNDRTPYLIEMMDAFCDPFVRQITLMCGTQLGKTEAWMNMMSYCIDEDPGPILICLPKADTITSFTKNRLLPTLKSCPKLKRRFTGRKNDEKTNEIKLDRVTIRLASAGSPDDLAAWPAKFFFGDECDKWPRWAGSEAAPGDLGRERVKNFTKLGSKVVFCCSPTTESGFIYIEFKDSDQRYYWVPCIHCERYQILTFANIRVPAGQRDPRQILKQNSARYVCPHCEKAMRDSDKELFLSAGIWVPKGCEIDAGGHIQGDYEESEHRGYCISSLYSPWVSWSEMIALWFKSYRKPSKLMNFVNGWLSEVFKEKSTSLDIDKIKERNLYEGASEYVPAGARFLTAGVDVQLDHFVLTVRAWGRGEESWQIMSQKINKWTDVEDILIHKRFKQKGSALKFRVSLACIDAAYRTKEVYLYCREHPSILRPVRGNDLGGIPYKANPIDRDPSTGKAAAGSLLLWHWDKGSLMDRLARYINFDEEAVTKWWVLNLDQEQYFREITSWEKVFVRSTTRGGGDRHEWVPKEEGIDDHFWFSECYASLAADMLGVERGPEDEEKEAYDDRDETPDEDGAGYDDWNDGEDHSGWIVPGDMAEY